MKREYTLLILGALTASIPWLAFTPSLNRIIFTVIGLWLIIIAYSYRSEKISIKSKTTKQEEPVNIPEPVIETAPQVEIVENNTQKYERKQPTRI
jgi:flagellar biosynthesis component FlhA